MQTNTLNMPNSLNVPMSNGAGDLRERQMTARRGGEAAAVEDGRERSLRERVMGARKALDLKERAKDKVAEKATAPARMVTSGLLKNSWLIMPTLIGFIPGLLYINLHVFGSVVFGEKFFCKLGDEWIPESFKSIADASGKMGGMIGLIEKAGLAMLDLAVILLILSILTILGIVGYAASAGIYEWVLAIWEFGVAPLWDIISAFSK